MASFYSELEELLNTAPSGFDELIEIEPRKRKQNPLPYSTAELKDPEKDRHCLLCGPPYKTLMREQLVGTEVCSFSCAKRYVDEVLFKPYGIRTKIAKSRRREDNLEINGVIGMTGGETTDAHRVQDAWHPL